MPAETDDWQIEFPVILVPDVFAHLSLQFERQLAVKQAGERPRAGRNNNRGIGKLSAWKNRLRPFSLGEPAGIDGQGVILGVDDTGEPPQQAGNQHDQRVVFCHNHLDRMMGVAFTAGLGFNPQACGFSFLRSMELNACRPIPNSKWSGSNPMETAWVISHRSQIVPKDFDLSPNFEIIKYNILGLGRFNYQWIWANKQEAFNEDLHPVVD